MDTPATADREGISRIERLCIERGLKMTGQRRLIARVLSDSERRSVEQYLERKWLQQLSPLGGLFVAMGLALPMTR